ncbi:MAG TPA: DUF6152 family protein [Steroidobacteraceae bacterium]|nr:DUF6152 family protein [Steroidobacteraceae bacterium]
MNKFIRYGAAALLGLGLAFAASAHHSAVQFDFGKQVQYTGTVKEFSAINPHMRMTLDWKDDKGKDHEVKFEGHSTNNMYRAGYRKGMVKSGDKITVNAAPYRDGTEGGYVIAVTTSDGQFFGMKGRAQQTGEEVRKQAEGK